MAPTTAPTTIARAATPVSVTEVRELRAHAETVMAGFDVSLVTASDAVEIGREVTRLKRRFEAVELTCAKRVADTALVRSRADHDGARATGRHLGVSNGEAASLLGLAGALAELPTTREAFESGQISRDQAAEIARTASVRPGVEADLVAVARHESLGELKRRGRKLRAVGEDGDAKLRRLHNERFLRTWTDDDGAGNGRWRLPPADHAELLAALAPWRDQLFADARRHGRREPLEAYDADALLELARDAAAQHARAQTGDGAAVDHHDDQLPSHELVHSPVTADDDTPDGQLMLVPGGSAPGPVSAGAAPSLEPVAARNAPEPSSTDPPRADRSSPPRRNRDKVIFRIDWTAARRGHTRAPTSPDDDEETCDIVGIGPVPVSVVREILEHDPFIAVVLTEGTDIRAVTHLGRSATALMRTALEWAQHGCSVLGCPNTARLQIDHRDDWATTKHTRLEKLDWLCPTHHQQKTHDRYHLEPGTGTRRFLPPNDP